MGGSPCDDGSELKNELLLLGTESTFRMSSKKIQNILHVTGMFPSVQRPYYGAFVKSQIDSLVRYGSGLINITVFAIEGLKGISPYIRAIPALSSVLRKKFDLVHCHYGQISLLVKMLTRGIPIVTSYCGSDLLGDLAHGGNVSLKSSIIKRVNLKFVCNDSFSIFKSKNLYEVAKNNVNVGAWEIVPNGVDLKKFRPLPKIEAREKIGLPVKGKYVLFAGNPSIPCKNYPMFNTAMHMIKSNSVSELCLESVEHELVPYYMNAADVIVLCSIQEGSPNVVKEAMACNRPIICTDVGDVRWLLGDVKGTTIVASDPIDLAYAIEQFIDEYECSEGRERIKELKLDLESTALKIINIYKRVLS